MKNVPLTIEDKDFDRLQELGYFKNRPFELHPEFEEILGLSEVDAKKLNKAYWSGDKNTSDEISKADNERLEQESLLLLLEDMLDITFNFDERKYVPKMSGVRDGEFCRTFLPEDITPEQAEILFRNLEKIESFYIKAKVADVLFESKKISDKDNLTVAEMAIEAYFNSANYILYNMVGFQRPFDIASNQLGRAAALMLSLKRNENLFDKLMEFFKREEFFKEDKDCILITSLGEIILGIKDLPKDKINLALEEYVKIFKILNPEDFLVLNKESIWDIGIRLSKKAKNLDYERFFKKQKGDAHCSAAERFQCDSYNRADHIKNAILAYKGVPEMKGKIEELSRELQENKGQIQNALASCEFGRLNLEPMRQLFEKELSGLKFEECLSKLVNLCIDGLYKNYYCIIKPEPKYPLISFFKAEYSNSGRSVYNAKPGECVVFFKLDVLFTTIALLIKNGLMIINKEHSFSHDTLLEFVKNSSFIPHKHKIIFAKGLNYFLHDQMLEALVLLVPQIENCLRHVLRSLTIVNSDLTEKNKIKIPELLNSCVENQILNEELKFYLENAICHEKDSLRYDIAHGEADDTIGNRDSSYVACMLILFLILKQTEVLKTKCDESRELNNVFSKIVEDGIEQLLSSQSKFLWNEISQKIR